MELLLSNDLPSFAEGLRQRVITGQQYNLIPAIGMIGWLGKLAFGSIYVDDKNPSSVTKILIKMKKVTSDDVESKVKESIGNDSIYTAWKYQMDRGLVEYNNYILYLWSDVKNVQDFSSFRSLIDDNHIINLKATDYHLANSFCQNFPIFGLSGSIDAHICVLEGSLCKFLCPNNYILKSLTIENANVAMSSYRFAARIKDNLLLCAANGFGVGAFQKDTDELISSAFVHWDGSISALQTVEGHQRKGLGKAVVTYLATILLERGLPVFTFVDKNVPSTDVNLNFFAKLGFNTKTHSVMSWRWNSFSYS